jgi:phage-related protein
METRRNLSKDAITGIKTDFVYEAGETLNDDKITYHTQQDVTGIVEANKRARNEIDRHQKHGEWSKVASIPMSIYYDLKAKGIADDPKRLAKWLNDSENRAFRTRDARI